MLDKFLPYIVYKNPWNLGTAPSTASVQVYLSKKYFKKKMLKESWACLKPQHVSASCSIPLIKIWTWQQSEASRQYKNHVHHIRTSYPRVWTQHELLMFFFVCCFFVALIANYGRNHLLNNFLTGVPKKL